LIKLILLLCLLACSFETKSKTNLFTISIDSHFIQDNGKIVGSEIRINNSNIRADTLPQAILTHYPAFDTIYHRRNSNEDYDIILTRFKPGEKYNIVHGCCAMFDIVKAKTADVFRGLSFEEYDSLRFHYFESAQVQFRMINYSGKDTIVGLYGDYAVSMEVTGAVMKNKKISQPLRAATGYYSSSIHPIVIAKIGVKQEIEKGFINDFWWPEMQIIKSFACRFFYNEKILVTYDAKSKEITVKLRE
jgi:hypothetical protein